MIPNTIDINNNLVLALNAGSSSVKASLLCGDIHILHALGERLTTTQSSIQIHFVWNDNDHDKRKDEDLDYQRSNDGDAQDSNKGEKSHNENDITTITIVEPMMDHERALMEIIQALQQRSLLEHVVGIGHRVVHGGTLYHESTRVTDETLQAMESISYLAPLHNPFNLQGIRLAREILPQVPNVAVFDTSFHATIPEKAYTYPLPLEYRQKNMRKFGFHGTSVQFVSQKAHDILSQEDEHKVSTTAATTFDSGIRTDPNANNNHNNKTNSSNERIYNIIVCHLGSGASVTAVVGNQSRDTSMGFTPLAGLMMGTRCGSVDPSLVGFACEELGKTVEQVMSDFNFRSGLKGMVKDGHDYDMRALLQRCNTSDFQQGDEEGGTQAQLAVDMFVYRLAQHIAAAMIGLDGPLDALVFTAGIGEHSAEIRRRTVQALLPIFPHVQLDEERNALDGKNSGGILSVDQSRPILLDIATDEEAMIAQECRRVIIAVTTACQ